MTKARSARIYTIPAGVAFLPALVRAILEGRLFPGKLGAPDPLELSRWTILLPTRRAVRACREAFIELDPGAARLLPVIRALGDVDEDELHITDAYGAGAAAELDLKPAATQPQRQFLLTRLVQDWAGQNPAGRAGHAINQSVSHALHMATSLMQLIDSLDTAEIDLGELPKRLADDPDMPMHRTEALDFLAYIAQAYPQAMDDAGLVGPQARRSALLRAESERLAVSGSPGPIVAAGSTGSVPATATLLRTIASLPEGAVVLPGLDTGLDDPSWDEIGDQHPQYGMKEFLAAADVERADVEDLPGLHASGIAKARSVLASETMRPSESTHLWRDIAKRKDQFQLACEGIIEIVCPELREQALTIALLMRKALDENRDCSLVTPDRRLARRVSSELERWNIHVDDSAGEVLSELAPGIFFRLVAEVCRPDARANDMVALLGHALMSPQLVRDAVDIETRQLARMLEVALFRQVHGGHQLEGLGERIALARKKPADVFAHPVVKRMQDADWDALAVFAKSFETALKPLGDIAGTDGRVPLASLLTTHVQVAEALCAGAGGVSDNLWLGEAGAALSDMLRQVLENAASGPAMPFADYCTFINETLRTVSVRRRYLLHPKLRILGLLEARLVQSELVILGGLNEGKWPGEMDPGPWLSRPQYKIAGLAMPERRLGLAAHDFVQGLGAEQVVLTWARKVGGTPSVASRWLLRLKAVLEATGLKDALEPHKDQPWTGWALGLDWHKDMPDSEKPAAGLRPVPAPPASARPGSYSVSRIERLMSDPYWVFANAVLRLKPLDPLDQEAGAAERGQLVHAVVEKFTKDHPDTMPQNAGELMKDIAVALVGDYATEPALRALWLPQVFRMIDWFCEVEQALRQDVVRQYTELQGEHGFKLADRDITVTARADRMDEFATGELRIVDYKTGEGKLMSHTTKGYKPQLFLEAWIAQQGGFGVLSKASARELMYIRLSGGEPAGEINTGPSGKKAIVVEDEVEVAADGVKQLIAAYLDGQQAYPAKPGQETWDRKGDYDHLSRWREWAMGSEANSKEGEGE